MVSEIAEKVFAVHDDIRSVILVNKDGEVVASGSRTKQPVAHEVQTGMAALWVGIMGGVLLKNPGDVRKNGLHSHQVLKLNLYGLPWRDFYLVFTIRLSFPPNAVSLVIEALRATQ